MPIQKSYLEQRRKDGYCASVFQSSKDSECSCHLKAGHSGLHRSATYRGKFYYWDPEGTKVLHYPKIFLMRYVLQFWRNYRAAYAKRRG